MPRNTPPKQSLEQPNDTDASEGLTPQPLPYTNRNLTSSDEWSGSPAAAAASRELTLDTVAQMKHNPLASPIISPISNPYASTTDDDEGLIFSRPSANNHDTYFPLQPPSSSTSLLRRRSTIKQLPSQLSHVQSSLATEVDDWDYTDTEWWGYIILLVTWIVFVVGMGSCLGVWSWAWDVGETPYAPPELEDDPTLPIVGYYPALMVLTSVMAWVWVVVAWVGMKYFRHAKVVQT